MTWPWLLAGLAAVIIVVIIAAALGFTVGRRGRPVAAPRRRAAGVDPADLLDGVIAAHDLSTGSDAVRVQLERALSAAGVHRITVEHGMVFDPGRHHAVGTEPATAGSTDRCVARVIRPGWQMGDRVVRPAEVIVWTR